MTEWVLVPVEPTQAMIDATNSVPEGAGYLSCVRAYRAMLDAAPQQAEPVAWMAFGGALVHAVTRNAMDPIEAERFDVPLYLHPPAAEVQRLRAAARDVCEWADAAQWALGNETGVPAAKLDALRKALEGGE